MASERRRFVRYRVKDNVFAALSDQAVIVGKLKDLSMGGAAFEFIPEASQEGRQPGTHRLDIFMLGTTQNLLSVPCSVVLRETTRPLAHIFFPTILSQICIAEFENLDQAQARDLLNFLMHHSVGYAA